MKFGAIVLLIMLVSGCHTCRVQQLIMAPPFHDYIGQTIELRSGAILYRRADGFFRDSYTLAPDSFDPHKDSPWVRRMEFYSLPIGTKVHLESICHERGYDSIDFITVKGSVTQPRSGDQIRFEYIWAAYESLKRAPWESVNTSTNRTVRLVGGKYVVR